MATAAGRVWIAVAAANTGVDVLELGPAATPGSSRGPCRFVGRFAGREPRLAALDIDKLVLVLRETQPDGGELLVARGIGPNANEWRPASRVTSRSLQGLEICGQLLLTRRGTLVLPTRWKSTHPDAYEVRCFVSRDGGARWVDQAPRRNGRDGGPIAAVVGDDETVLLLDTPASLVAYQSTEDLSSPGDIRKLPVAGDASSYRVIRSADGLNVIWIESNADSMFAPPYIPNLRCALSTDEGASWQPSRALALRPGCLTDLRAGGFHDGALTFLIDQRCPGQYRIACIGWDPSASHTSPRATGRSPYTEDLESARLALRVLATHTLERPSRCKRLFVEGYFMRGLVAAAESLAGADSSDFQWFAPERAVRCATDWADSLVASQAWNGFWKLGYHAEWYADMAAALGLFPALEAHVDSVRAGRYERAAVRFLRGLEREHMVLPNGAVGIGRAFVVDRHRRANRARRDPYLVSTALAGIAVPAWLYRRTGDASYHDRALAALDYTLSQITDDGFAEPVARHEGSLRVAAYIEEGWMAADAFLGDPALRARLHARLRPHVDWLLRVQQSDGTWDGGEPGGFARTPAIIDFLIWYDQAGAPREDVRAAVARASVAFHDPDHWRALGLFRTDEDHEVLRALAGRPLAALVRGGPVQ